MDAKISAAAGLATLTGHRPAAAAAAKTAADDGGYLFREIGGLEIDPVREYLRGCDLPFEASQLYDSQKEEKVTDDTMRRSEFRLVKDSAFFDLLRDGILLEINRTDTSKVFSLVRNDVSHIVYGPGDFFKRHSDYLSVTSNVIEEYTLIVCVTPNESEPPSGGQTLIHTWPHRTHQSTATTTPGGGLLFRKDLEHEGAKLHSGAKHIITLNLWAMQKTSDAPGRILHVTFPIQSTPGDSSSKRQKTGSDPQAYARALRESATSRSYAIPVTALQEHTNNYWSALLSFSDVQRDAGENDTQHISEYKCTDASYDEFETIFKILNRSYVTPTSVRSHAALIDFYGMDRRRILVDLATHEHKDEEASFAGPDIAVPTPTAINLLTHESLGSRVLSSELLESSAIAHQNKLDYLLRVLGDTHDRADHCHDIGYEQVPLLGKIRFAELIFRDCIKIYNALHPAVPTGLTQRLIDVDGTLMDPRSAKIFGQSKLAQATAECISVVNNADSARGHAAAASNNQAYAALYRVDLWRRVLYLLLMFWGFKPLKSWLAPLLPDCLAEPITFDEIVQWVLADDDSDSDVAATSHERSLSEVMSALPDSALLSVVLSAAVSCFKAASSLCDELSQCQF